MKILSLFDGMACGMLAFQRAGIPVEEYNAYEIDKYAIKTATHNFPNIKELGDVFKADFAQYEGIDFLIGGSPCTYWSIAQSPDKRETTASGMGWELFGQYVRALHEAKPRYFLYENNKSMAKAIYQSISETFGFEPIMINSALVSAQNRQRYYWVGKREPDSTYSKVDIQQPEDRGILLKDILESGCDLMCNNKAYAQTASYNGAVPWNTIERKQRTMRAEPVCVAQRGRYTDTGNCHRKTDAPTEQHYEARPNGELSTSQGMRVYDVKGKSVNITANGGGAGAKTGLYAIPVACRCRGRKDKNGNGYAKYECRADEKANNLDTNTTNGSMVAQPVFAFQDCVIRDKAHITVNENAIRGVQDKNGASCAENVYELTGRKAYTLTTAHTPKIIDNIENYKCYAIPVEFDGDIPTKAISSADGKTYTVYRVHNGNITINEKEYPIKLIDGYYIIRKLTVRECMRLQTLPEWYEFPVSDTQAYKMLGNGWTVDVIAHILKGIKEEL